MSDPVKINKQYFQHVVDFFNIYWLSSSKITHLRFGAGDFCCLGFWYVILILKVQFDMLAPWKVGGNTRPRNSLEHIVARLFPQGGGGGGDCTVNIK